ncbi:glycosyltransferase [Algoriphagus halophytocola]|uniref:Glycosyltransferase n=1 Tax=Algoriphagus halophytocola TaxID=2991499 RepID=A0ABY6MLA3_9BACT|nr:MULTISPECIES: glycosyltransferase [unclassified Algoriphagus]UZD23953.1 glycosyltransferase [Algoriphagus sp. TR-M5]WBL41324.1 glycosyltransferase [Algoriphagus sp. TR-M9]
MRAVNSLLQQPEINQIILVDDGSQDNSLELCERFANEYPQIQVLRHEAGKNRGAPASRNLGLQHVSNQWVQFMDADDELLPGKISDQVKLITDDIGLIVGKFKFPRNGTWQESLIIHDIWAGLITTRLGNTIANLWNVQWVKKAGAWNPDLLNVQEYHLMFELLKINPNVAFSGQALTLVHPQKNSISNSGKNLNPKRDTYFKFRKAIRNHLKEKGIYTLKRQHYYNITTGDMLRYHSPEFPVQHNKLYYIFYRGLKNLAKLKRS